MHRRLPVFLCAALAACSGLRPGPVPPPPSLEDPPEEGAGEVYPHGLLPFFYDLYTFRDGGGLTRVVASFAVPAGRLEEERTGDGVLYRFEVTLVLADTARGTLRRTDDSVFVRASRPLSDEHLLYTQVEVDAPPSATTVQRVIMHDAAVPGVGQLYESAFPVPDYGGDSLMVSDIALGQPDVEGGWSRGDVRLALLPTSQFPESAFDVYYEVYNLPAGHPYTTEITVEPLPRPGEPEDAGGVTRLRFSGESTAVRGRPLAELRRVDTSLSEGRYRLTLAITDEVDGRTARSDRLFQVQGWGPGTTLVPALPRGLLHSPP